jgi:hypothetical protein
MAPTTILWADYYIVRPLLLDRRYQFSISAANKNHSDGPVMTLRNKELRTALKDMSEEQRSELFRKLREQDQTRRHKENEAASALYRRRPFDAASKRGAYQRRIGGDMDISHHSTGPKTKLRDGLMHWLARLAQRS